jgi:AcrR family transcriptional regulator
MGADANREGPLWASVQPATARNLLLAALDSFAAVGYHAATTRDIAERAGVSPAGVYLHYASKSELLEAISRLGHEDALAAIERGLASAAAGSPGDRLREAVRAFATWHAENHRLARVDHYELRSLQPEQRARIVGLRDRIEERLRAVLEAGVEAGEFAVDDLRATSTAILSLCIDIARWYSPSGRLTPREIGDLYASLAHRLVASPGPAGAGAEMRKRHRSDRGKH